MSKQKKTTADKIGNATNTISRADRWRKCAEKRLGVICEESAAILGALAELNELDPVEFVVRNLCKERGLDTDTPDRLQQYDLEIDEYYENESTRRLNAHDADLVKMYIGVHSLTQNALNADEAVSLIRRYGRKGDTSLHAITNRIVRAALAA